MVASRCPHRFLVAAFISRSTSASVRYSRVRRSALGSRLGLTVRFTVAGVTGLRCRLVMRFALPGVTDCSDNGRNTHSRKTATRPWNFISSGAFSWHLDNRTTHGRRQERCEQLSRVFYGQPSLPISGHSAPPTHSYHRRRASDCPADRGNGPSDRLPGLQGRLHHDYGATGVCEEQLRCCASRHQYWWTISARNRGLSARQGRAVRVRNGL